MNGALPEGWKWLCLGPWKNQKTSQRCSRKMIYVGVTIQFPHFYESAQPYFCTDNQYVWIAAADIGRDSGDLVWADETQIDPLAWAPGEPNNVEEGQETCVNFSGYSGRLYDARCETATKFMCKLPKQHYTCPQA